MLRGARDRYASTTRVIVDGYDIQCLLIEGGKTMRGAITAGLSGKNVSELAKVVDCLRAFAGLHLLDRLLSLVRSSGRRRRLQREQKGLTNGCSGNNILDTPYPSCYSPRMN